MGENKENIREEFYDSLPEGIFYGPTFELEKRENHDGMGYHCHVRIRKNGGFQRAGYIITLEGDKVFIMPHNKKQLFDCRKKSHSLLRDILEEIKQQLLPVSKNTLPLSEKSFLLTTI